MKQEIIYQETGKVGQIVQLTLEGATFSIFFYKVAQEEESSYLDMLGRLNSLLKILRHGPCQLNGGGRGGEEERLAHQPLKTGIRL